jgi:hypothetical protein
MKIEEFTIVNQSELTPSWLLTQSEELARVVLAYQGRAYPKGLV